MFNSDHEKNDGQRNEKKSKGVPLSEMIKKAKETPVTPFIWNGIQSGSFGYIFGPSKSGKTTLSENLGMCIANGEKEFLGIPIEIENHKVLFVSLEEYWKPRTERNAKQAERFCTNGEIGWLENFIVVNDEFPRFLSSKKDWDDLESLFQEYNPGIVFIDSLTRIVSGQIEDSREAKQIGIKLRALANKYETAIICIHHCPKLLGNELNIDSLAGSRVLSQDADFAIGVNRNASGTRYLKNVFLRYADDSADKAKIFTIDKNQWVVLNETKSESKILQADDGRRNDANRDLIFEFIKQTIESGIEKVLTQQLIQEFVMNGKIVKSTLYDCLDVLEGEERIARIKKGEYTLKRNNQVD